MFNTEFKDGKVKVSLDNLSTNWLDKNDSFLKRIDKDNLNKVFLNEHIKKEIEIKNTLDCGINLLKHDKYTKAIVKFDEVLFYDNKYAAALINKSYALRAQKHFVKSLRYYKKAVNASSDLKDVEYYKMLIGEASRERDEFPKIKRNIYAGDEYFTKGEFTQAVKSYDRALENPSKFREKILTKLLNKKATALLKLNEYKKAYECFTQSVDCKSNDYAYFGCGVCQFNLDLDLNVNFKKLLDIDKNQMLKQVIILNELKYFNESLNISDYLMENTFIVDDYYIKLVNARINTMKELDGDFSKLEDILNNI